MHYWALIGCLLGSPVSTVLFLELNLSLEKNPRRSTPAFTAKEFSVIRARQVFAKVLWFPTRRVAFNSISDLPASQTARRSLAVSCVPRDIVLRLSVCGDFRVLFRRMSCNAAWRCPVLLQGPVCCCLALPSVLQGTWEHMEGNWVMAVGPYL